MCSKHLGGRLAALALEIEWFLAFFHKIDEIKVVIALELGEQATGEAIELEPSNISHKVT